MRSPEASLHYSSLDSLPSSPNSPNSPDGPDNKNELIRPTEIFEIDDHTTDVICCINAEITSPSLVYVARQQGLDQISCLSGGLTGLALYLKHLADDSDNILRWCHPDYQLPRFKNKIDKLVHDDTGYHFRDYYKHFFLSPNIQNVNFITHAEGLANVVRMSDFAQYLRHVFPDVHIFSNYFDVAHKYQLDQEKIKVAFTKIQPKTIHVTETLENT